MFVQELWNFGIENPLDVESVVFCRSLEDENVEISAEDGGLTCDVSEATLKTVRALCYFELRCWG